MDSTRVVPYLFALHHLFTIRQRLIRRRLTRIAIVSKRSLESPEDGMNKRVKTETPTVEVLWAHVAALSGFPHIAIEVLIRTGSKSKRELGSSSGRHYPLAAW